MRPPAATAAGSSLRRLIPTSVEQPEPDPSDTLRRSTRAMHDAAAVIDQQAATIRRLRYQRAILAAAVALLVLYLAVG